MKRMLLFALVALLTGFIVGAAPPTMWISSTMETSADEMGLSWSDIFGGSELPPAADVTRAAQPVPAAAVQSGDRVYAFPASELDAFDACVTAEREDRGIPGSGEYLAWWAANSGTETERDWSAAFDRCLAENIITSPWNFGALVRVR